MRLRLGSENTHRLDSIVLLLLFGLFLFGSPFTLLVGGNRSGLVSAVPVVAESACKSLCTNVGNGGTRFAGNDQDWLGQDGRVTPSTDDGGKS
jgi:hypothetical protein